MICSQYQLISGYSLVFVIADVINALLIRATGQSLQMAYGLSLKSLGLHHLSQKSGY